ncbi:MAG: FG-GAP-like repeat-containing protein, partial [Planctomycetota bacterium]
LAIVKSGPATFVPGSPFTWTIVVTNAGPSTSTNASVQDTLPAGVTSAAWTAVPAGGATVTAPSGSGSIATAVTLPAGGSVTFTVVAQTDPAATTPLVNTATVTPTDGLPDPNPDDRTSTTTTTPAPTADLSVVKTDGATTYVPGRSVTYTITVSNAGPSAVSGARVRDVLPGIVTTASWTAAFTGGAGATSGSGGIDELIDLAPGGSAVYTLVAITSSTAGTSLVNTATVTPPDGGIDPNPGNETSTDVNTPDFSPGIIVAPDIGCDSTPLVSVLDPVTGDVRTQFYAYEPGFRGGVRLFGADLTGDGIPEIITAPGPGRPGLVKVFTQDGTELPEYRTFPFGPGFSGGVEVAAGDVTGDGQIDLVAAQGGQGSLVRTFTVTPGAADPVANTPSRQIRPFGPTFRGGARVTTADIGTFSGASLIAPAPDGIAELVVGSGPGIRATVNTYNAVPSTPVRVNSVNPIGPRYNRGVGVATLPSATGGADQVLVTAGTAGGSRVETYAGVGRVPAASFAAYGGAAARAAVWSAALDEQNIFSVQGLGGTTSGVRKNTSPSGGTSSTLAGSTGLVAPLRVGTLRRPLA